MAEVVEVGVFPEDDIERYERLLSALERAYPVSFVGANLANIAKFATALCLSGEPEAHPTPTERETHFYIVESFGQRQTKSSAVQFGNDAGLNRYLRGRTLIDQQATELPVLTSKPGDKIRASIADKPIWIHRKSARRRTDLVAAAPSELNEGETLREHLSAGRFIHLLPLVHFIREITQEFDWSPPPLRACFILDDPNLRGSSYGYLRYPQLLSHARQHNYHIAIATIPLDSWAISAKTAELFRQNRDRMSLLVHGNNHTHHELDRRLSEKDRLALLAQALRRVDRIEKKTHTPVSRVMVPPHEVCSDAMLRSMRLLDFEAASINRSRWPSFLASPDVLSGWGLAEVVAGGFPVISRARFKKKYRDDIPLLAFLNQPIVLYGHHHEVNRDFSKLAEIAELINSLGEVCWQDMTDISRSNYLTRRSGATLFVRLYSRRVVVDLPKDVEEVVVELATSRPMPLGVRVVVESSPLSLSGGAPFPRTQPWHRKDLHTVEIRVVEPSPIAHRDVPAPSVNLWAILRRLYTESHDRAMPLFRR